LSESKFAWDKIIVLIIISVFSVIQGCTIPNLVDYSAVFENERIVPTAILHSNWKEIDVSKNRFFVSDDFLNRIVYERTGTNGLIAFSVSSKKLFEDLKFNTELVKIYRELLLPPHNDLRVYFSGKFISFEDSVSTKRFDYYRRAEFLLKGKMGLKLEIADKKEREEQLHALESFSGPYTQKELKRGKDFRSELLNVVDTRKYRMKVVAYMYKNRIFRFLYINTPRYYEADLELFNSFERSVVAQFSSKI